MKKTLVTIISAFPLISFCQVSGDYSVLSNEGVARLNSRNYMIAFEDKVKIRFRQDIDYKASYMKPFNRIRREEWLREPELIYEAPNSVNESEFESYSSALYQIYMDKINSPILKQSFNICIKNTNQHYLGLADEMDKKAKLANSNSEKISFTNTAKEIREKWQNIAPGSCLFRFIKRVFYTTGIPDKDSWDRQSQTYQDVSTGQLYRGAHAIVTNQLTEEFYKKMNQELNTPEADWMKNYMMYSFNQNGDRINKFEDKYITFLYQSHLQRASNVGYFLGKGMVRIPN